MPPTPTQRRRVRSWASFPLTQGVEATTNDLELKSVGTFYLAGADGTLTPGANNDDEVADGAEPKQVYSFTAAGETMLTYVVLTTESTTDGAHHLTPITWSTSTTQLTVMAITLTIT